MELYKTYQDSKNNVWPTSANETHLHDKHYETKSFDVIFSCNLVAHLLHILRVYDVHLNIVAVVK